jgi:hypothetical protein
MKPFLMRAKGALKKPQEQTHALFHIFYKNLKDSFIWNKSFLIVMMSWIVVCIGNPVWILSGICMLWGLLIPKKNSLFLSLWVLQGLWGSIAYFYFIMGKSKISFYEDIYLKSYVSYFIIGAFLLGYLAKKRTQYAQHMSYQILTIILLVIVLIGPIIFLISASWPVIGDLFYNLPYFFTISALCSTFFLI